ncbi:AraC family chemosensory pili system transcriptional regulator ChpD [Nonomuraea thailandensis]|uniref:AraC family chemosensory pili system transcriptional regulator ChpD n=1 Tax=Nonomuraea thailandensis TaxID=1188745 RepID=A0A9X2GV44_9ACTN|nr:AraC family transcriptional regulator [Nonomuraea thailandensis]MCP2364384.1 AraC family chemosensory pili system transcriptional regulator ChpD [Nonomuraea thailandensis]
MQVRDVNGTQLAVVTPASGGFARHSHDEYVISVNVSGRERVRLDRSSFEVDLDEVTAYNPGQVQSCTTRTPEGAAFTCVSWYVPPDVLGALVGGPPPDFSRSVVRAPRLRNELLRAAGRLAVTRSGDPGPVGPPGAGPGRDEAVALVEERLVLVLLRLLDLAAPAQARRSPEPEPGDARIAAVLDRLRADLSSAPRLADLAGEAGMSREHLVRSFTRATGCPPYAWHLQARLAEGRRRLRGGLGVAEVAHGLGFADQAHFHRHFTAAYAITPGRYRAVNI